MADQWIDQADLWKSKARSLQLRLRDRFRVAVDRHRRRPSMFADGYFSATLARWLRRYRDFRRDSLPSSSSFYRKRVSKEFDEEEASTILRMLQAVAVPVIGNVCHVFMHGLNNVQIYGMEKLHDALLNRPKEKPLITVSNHVASVDDPFVIASLLPPSILLDAQNLRWTMCATDRCFKNPATSAFFRCVKVLPVSRGDGIYQKGMDMAISKLNSGGWVHIFPEGSRSRDGGKTLGSPKRGVGRLILDADKIPMVVPFVHTGMQDVMPIGAKIPRIGKTVIVLVGDPILFDDILNIEESKEVSRGKLYDSVASRIGVRLQELKNQLDWLALEHAKQLYSQPMENSERAMGILQQVDWDSQRHEPLLLQGSEERHDQEWMPRDPLFRMGFSYKGGFMSHVRGFVDPSDLMGFAARGLFMSRVTVERTPKSIKSISPLKTWKRFLEDNVLQNWSTC
ncbi:hypothetical protein SAY86_006143 [Trapa natans]|uniref:Tafazzin family protein n=1 Tax=Trapa natans TaxID=22666 RepID=A0AAN7LBI3_TRANT|nr:hypothetical protein SAY86_006143 [Trapa natans]